MKDVINYILERKSLLIFIIIIPCLLKTNYKGASARLHLKRQRFIK